MKRMIHAALSAAILTSGLGSVGCVNTDHPTMGDRGRNALDPCYPERYQHAARQAVIAPFAQQAYNGHVLNQTIWNYYFELGSDKLTSSGMEKLDSIARTRPAPDPKVYIQASMDLAATADNAGKISDLRNELDVKRAQAIQKYLATVPTYLPVAYEIHVHNPATPGINAEMAAGAYRGSFLGYRGGVSGASTGSAQGTGGSSNLTAGPAGAAGSSGAGATRP